MRSDHAKTIVSTDEAPRVIGPQSQAVGFGGLLFVSGQIGVDPESGELVSAGIEGQTSQLMSNLREVLEAAGLDFTHVVQVTLYLGNMHDLGRVDHVYEAFLDENPPARTVVEVSRLPQGASVALDLIAAAPTPPPAPDHSDALDAPDDESPDDESPDDESPDDESPDDESPDDESPDRG